MWLKFVESSTIEKDSRKFDESCILKSESFHFRCCFVNRIFNSVDWNLQCGFLFKRKDVGQTLTEPIFGKEERKRKKERKDESKGKKKKERNRRDNFVESKLIDFDKWMNE